MSCNKYYQILTVILGSFFGLPHSFAVTINAAINQGFIPVDTFSGTVTTPQGAYLDSTSYPWAGFTFAPTSIGSGFCSSNVSNWTTIDGYYGYEVTTGVLMVIYDTNVTGNVVSASGGTTSVNGIFNSYGILAGSIPPKSNSVNCYSYVTSATSTSISTTTQINGKYGYYISSNAVAGSFSPTIIGFRRAQGRGSTTGNYASINKSDTLIIASDPIISCTISPPESINFANVNTMDVTNGQLLSYKNGNLNVVCSGTNEPSASISITGDTARYSNTLKMKMANPTDSAPAEIRGFIGPDINQAGVCNDNTNYPGWIQFDATKNQKISLGKIKSGTNTIPYSFSLCSTGSSARGDATAAAIVDLTWD